MNEFIIGIVTGILGWAILAHLVVPSLSFSKNIAKTYEGNKFRYRIKVNNTGWRSIIDVQLAARLRIPDLSTEPGRVQILYIPIGYNEHTPIIPPHRQILFHLRITNIDTYGLALLPGNVVECINNGSVTLEDMLNMHKDATLQFYIFGYDRLSGARKLFESKRYTLKDILLGAFPKDGMEVEQEAKLSG